MDGAGSGLYRQARSYGNGDAACLPKPRKAHRARRLQDQLSRRLPEEESTPVRYVFGTAEFTPEGLASARDLSECLKSVKPKAITLTGHTDPVGTQEANRVLSLARADALAEYLVAEGYAGAWKTLGKGEDEPFKADDASAYDEETLNQMNRARRSRCGELNDAAPPGPRSSPGRSAARCRILSDFRSCCRRRCLPL